VNSCLLYMYSKMRLQTRTTEKHDASVAIGIRRRSLPVSPFPFRNPPLPFRHRPALSTVIPRSLSVIPRPRRSLASGRATRGPGGGDKLQRGSSAFSVIRTGSSAGVYHRTALRADPVAEDDDIGTDGNRNGRRRVAAPDGGSVLNGPGSAVQRFTPHCARDTKMPIMCPGCGARAGVPRTRCSTKR